MSRTGPGARRRTFAIPNFYPQQNYRGSGGGGKSGSAEKYRLNPRDTVRLWNIYHQTPSLRIGSEAFKGRLFHIPFEVVIGGVGAPQLKIKDNVRDLIVEKYWMPWIANIHDRLKMFGIAPYYFKAVPIVDNANTSLSVYLASLKGGGDDKTAPPSSGTQRKSTVHFVPIVPEYGSGYIETYLDKNMEQQFVWTWNDDIGSSRLAGQEDGRMYWAIQHKPTIYGEYTGVLNSSLKPWVHASAIINADIIVAKNKSNPMHVIESHPNINGGGGGGAQEQIQGSRLSNMYPGVFVEPDTPDALDIIDIRESRIEQQRYGVLRSGGDDIGLSSTNDDMLTNLKPAMYERVQLELHKRKHPELFHTGGAESMENKTRKRLPPNTLKLAAYEKYVNCNQPEQTRTDVLQLLERLDKIFAALADFPIETIMNQSGTNSAAKDDSSKNYTINRLKTQSKLYAKLIKKAWKEAYAPLFIKEKNEAERMVKKNYGRKPTEQEWAWIERQLDITVKFPRSPFGTFDELIGMYTHGMIDEKQFYKFAIDLIGLPIEDQMPKEVTKKLKQNYDPEYQHNQEIRWRKQEIKEGIDDEGIIDKIRKNNVDNGSSASTSKKISTAVTKTSSSSTLGKRKRESAETSKSNGGSGDKKKKKKKTDQQSKKK